MVLSSEVETLLGQLLTSINPAITIKDESVSSGVSLYGSPTALKIVEAGGKEYGSPSNVISNLNSEFNSKYRSLVGVSSISELLNKIFSSKPSDLGVSVEGTQTQSQLAQQEGTDNVKQPLRQEEIKKKIDNGIISNPVTNSENQVKTYNFGTELRNATSRTHVETINFLIRKGVYNENMSLNAIKSELKKLNISFDTVTNEDSFIEMLNNCK